MQSINRENSGDAQRVIDKLISDETIKRDILSFLSGSIIYAHELNSQNWNLNLDKHGKFVRFNVGQEYCIEMYPKYISVLVLKEYIPNELVENQFNIEFKGYYRKKVVLSSSLGDVPDCLVKIPGSIGCHMRYDRNITQILSLLEEPNRKFIEEAIFHTKIQPLMIRAHSTGFIAYLSQYSNKQIFNPSYVNIDVSNNFLANPLEEIEKYRSSYADLPETERQTVIQSRIGQGQFRSELIQYWGKCAVTGCQKIKVLRASHIKPWRVSSNQERLDVHNGLLLVPNLDAAFDAGLVSFDDDGKIMISPLLSEDDRDKLEIHPLLRISGLTEHHIKYLQYHRKHIFRNI